MADDSEPSPTSQQEQQQQCLHSDLHDVNHDQLNPADERRPDFDDRASTDTSLTRGDGDEPELPADDDQLPNGTTTTAIHNSRSEKEKQKAREANGGGQDDDDERPDDDERLGQGSKDDDETEEAPIIVDWDGEDDPCSPRNWSYKKKWASTAIVSAFTFMSPLSSSMIAPASNQLAVQFGSEGKPVTNTVLIAMYTSIFVLAYAIGPLFLGPLSELYGRAIILQGSNLFYLIWNIACGFAQNTPSFLIFRFLAGIGGSAPLAIGGGVLGDVWRTHERGRAIALYSLAPLLGPVIGPIAGAWIAQKTTWRWVFWSSSAVNVGVQGLGFLFLRETFHPILLERKLKRRRKEMVARGEEADARRLKTPYQGGDRHWKHLFAKSIIRPFALFAREPIIQLLGLYMAFIYGILYLVLTTMPSIFQAPPSSSSSSSSGSSMPPSVYNESPGIAGLNYIALGVGLTGASQINARLLDRVYMWLSERERRAWEAKRAEVGNKEKNGGGGGEELKKRFGRPEFRLPSMFPGTLLMPAGLLMVGWAAEKHVHWIVVDIGIAFIGAGMILNFQSIQTYVIDAFTLHAASALAAVSCFRSLAGFGFPLFAPTMFAKLGYGKGDTILAVFAIVIGCPAPWLFWTYGERIRKASRYAGKS